MDMLTEMEKGVDPEKENQNIEQFFKRQKYISLSNGEELCYYDFFNPTASETLIFL